MQFLLGFLQGLPAEYLLFGFLLVSLLGLAVSARLGVEALYAFNTVAVIVANIQVLKVAKLSFLLSPVALGTIVISSTYLCNDLLNEVYGPRHALRATLCSFFASIFFTVLMVLTVGVRPEAGSQAHAAMTHIFSPSPGIVAASLVAYFVSQVLDIYFFSRLRTWWAGRYLGLRSYISTAAAFFVDSLIFSYFAWVIFSPEPMPWDVLWQTYILGTFGLRLLVNMGLAPALSLLKRVTPHAA